MTRPDGPQSGHGAVRLHRHPPARLSGRAIADQFGPNPGASRTRPSRARARTCSALLSWAGLFGLMLAGHKRVGRDPHFAVTRAAAAGPKTSAPHTGTITSENWNFLAQGSLVVDQ